MKQMKYSFLRYNILCFERDAETMTFRPVTVISKILDLTNNLQRKDDVENEWSN